MLIKDWLPEFLEKNWPAFAGVPWSRDDPNCRRAWSEWMNSLREVQGQRSETELAAELTASRRGGQILDSPDSWLACIVAEIKSIRAATPGSAPLSERAAARDASRDCPHCGGGGLVILDRQSPSTVAAHCVCAMGRWMRKKTEQDLIRRIPDFSEALSDRSHQAAAALREFYELGWEFRWYPEEGQFRTYRARTDVPAPTRELSHRCRELRSEIYDLLGHAIEAEEVLAIDDFRDENGRFQWLGMARALADKIRARGGRT